MKRCLAVILSLLLILSCAACGANGSPAASGSASSAPAASEPAASEPAASASEQVSPDQQPAEPEFRVEVTAKDATYSFVAEKSGVYAFDSGELSDDHWEHSHALWTVYAEDHPVMDNAFDETLPVIRNLGDFSEHVIHVALEEGQTVYVLAASNGYGESGDADWESDVLTITMDDAPATPCAENGYVFAVTTGAVTRADLDGDGTEDEIYYAATPGTADEDGTWGQDEINALAINGVSMLSANENPFDAYGFWLENPYVNCYYLVDLVKDDGKLELAVTDWGSNDWTSTYYFDYADGGLTLLGTVPGFPDDESTTIDGGGTIQASQHLNVMQTWRGLRTFQLENGKIEAVPGFVEPIITGYEEPVKLIQPLTVYEDHDQASSTLVLQPSDDPISLPLTDGEHWVQIVCADGSTGWAYFPEFSQVQNGDVVVSDSEVFEGLLFAG